jgi:hypothetical protein
MKRFIRFLSNWNLFRIGIRLLIRRRAGTIAGFFTAEMVDHFENSRESRSETMRRLDQGVLKGFRLFPNLVNPLLHVNVDLRESEFVFGVRARQDWIEIGELGFRFVRQGNGLI